MEGYLAHPCFFLWRGCPMSVEKRLRNQEELRSMRPTPFEVGVFRARKWQKVSSEDLCPGDLVSIRTMMLCWCLFLASISFLSCLPATCGCSLFLFFSFFLSLAFFSFFSLFFSFSLTLPFSHFSFFFLFLLCWGCHLTPR